MVQPIVRMICSDYSHMPLLTVWRDSGVTEEHGFKLEIHLAGLEIPGQPFVSLGERASKLLDGTYDIISGLHHEPYHYRARGDKRFVYLAQAQNDWDDRVVVNPRIKTAKDLEGEKLLITARAPCVLGNLKQSLKLAGADPDLIDFVDVTGRPEQESRMAVDAVVRGEAIAASVDMPFDLQAEKQGLKSFPLPNAPVIHNVTICTNNDWVKANQETVFAFLRSMIDAIHFFKTQPSRVCELLEAYLAPIIGLESRDEVEYLQRVWAELLCPKPYPHPLAVWNVYNLDVAHDPSVNFIGPFETWDTSYLRVIDDSGYIDEMYGGAAAAANPPITAAIWK